MVSVKTTRRALFTSILALLVCVSMLVGTTFAWFTDSVTSGVNKIIAGNLDVDAEYTTDGTNFATIEGVGNIFQAPAGGTTGLWEPGHVEVAYVKVTNLGTLALKYQIAIDPFNEITGTNADGDTITLSEVLKCAVVDYTGIYADRDAALNDTNPATDANLSGLLGLASQTPISLAPGIDKTVALIIYMPTGVGNEANYTGTTAPEINFSISVVAGQDTVEFDSFDDQYDASATFAVVDQSGFADALAAAAAGTGPKAIQMSAGDYEIPAGTSVDGLTLIGDTGGTGTNVDTVNVSGGTAATLSNFTANNINFESSNAENWDGIFSHNTTLDNATFTNCTFSTEGDPRTNGIYGPTLTDTTFENCTIYGDTYGINFSYVNGTLTLKNCDITGWNSFGGGKAGAASNVVVENCTFHKSGYGVLRFYQNATVSNCVFDSDVTIDANVSGATITISGCQAKDVTSGALSALPTDQIKNNGSNTNTWILDGVDVSASIGSW